MPKNDSLNGTTLPLRKIRQRESAVPKHRYGRYQIADIINYYCIFATQRTNNMKYDSPYFEFIENNHPQYYSDDRVLLCDILFRFI